MKLFAFVLLLMLSSASLALSQTLLWEEESPQFGSGAVFSVIQQNKDSFYIVQGKGANPHIRMFNKRKLLWTLPVGIKRSNDMEGFQYDAYDMSIHQDTLAILFSGGAYTRRDPLLYYVSLKGSFLDSLYKPLRDSSKMNGLPRAFRTLDGGYLFRGQKLGPAPQGKKSTASYLRRYSPRLDSLWHTDYWYSDTLENTTMYVTEYAPNAYIVGGDASCCYPFYTKHQEHFLMFFDSNGKIRKRVLLQDSLWFTTATMDKNSLLRGYGRKYEKNSPLPTGFIAHIDTSGYTKAAAFFKDVEFYSLLPAQDGGFIGVGSYNYLDYTFRHFVVKLDSAMKVQWTYTGAVRDTMAGIYAVIPTEKNTYLMLGRQHEEYLYMAELRDEGKPNSVVYSIEDDALVCEPNPTHDILFIEARGEKAADFGKLYDNMGREIMTLAPGYHWNINTSLLASGMYTIILHKGNVLYKKQICVVH